MPEPARTGHPGDRVQRLPDGRLLGYRESGDLAGIPVFFFHGLGAARTTTHPDEAIALGLGVRLIAVDRPGIGLSTPQASRRILDWPRDVAYLADALGFDRFAIFAHSGGVPYAYATAAAYPERVAVVAAASGMAPLVGPGVARYAGSRWVTLGRFGRWAPFAVRFAYRNEARGFLRKPEAALDDVLAPLAPPDREMLAEPAMRRMMLDTIAECFRQGAAGAAEDAIVLSRAWGFEVTMVEPSVLLCHGEADTVIPIDMSRYLAEVIADVETSYLDEAGHYLYLQHWSDILRAIVDRAWRTVPAHASVAVAR